MAATLVTPYSNQKNLTDGQVVIKITAADFAGISYQEGRIVLGFEFCRFNKLTIINEEEIPFRDISIAFFSCIIDDLVIEQITTKNITVGFYGCVLKGVIKNENVLQIELNNCILTKSIFILGVQRAVVKFTKENMQLYRWKQLFKQYKITGYSDLLERQMYYFSESKIVEMSSNYDFTSKNNKFKIGVSLRYEGDSKDSTTTIADIQLFSLSLSGNPAGKVSVQNVKIGSWYVFDFNPKDEVGFYNIEPAAVAETEIKIGIHTSNLDKVWFDNVAFAEYPIISFFRTKFSKATFTACSFPENYKQFTRFRVADNVHYPEVTPPNYAKDQYEIFLQLKKALEDSGNSYEALKMHAISHEALLKIKSITCWDRTILRINSWSNNHGLSIQRPLAGFFIFSIFFYLLYLWNLNRLFASTSFDPRLIGYYFSFVDITHRTDFLVKPEEYTGWTLTLDYINKLMVGFFIFQFIAAFRKYGKK